MGYHVEPACVVELAGGVRLALGQAGFGLLQNEGR